MQVKKLDTRQVSRITGLTSRELTDKCPDRLVAFPSSPCTNIDCEYAIKQPGYKNCTFVAAEAGGEHTLESVGEMMGISREGIRKIEVRAMRKLREALDQKTDNEDKPSISQPSSLSGPDSLRAVRSDSQLKDSSNVLSDRNDRKLEECAG